MGSRILIADSGSGYGGSAKYLMSLLPLIDRQQFSVELVAYGNGPFIQKIEKNGWSVHQFPSWRFPWGSGKKERIQSSVPRSIFSYVRYLMISIVQLTAMVPVVTFWLKYRRIQLVHINNEILSHLPLIIGARLTGCKILCHMHGWRNLTTMEKWVGRCVDQFIAVSQSGADFYSWQLKGKQVIGVPNGISAEDELVFDERRRIAKRAELGVGEHDCLAVIIGRLIAWKGHAVLFRSIAKAKEKCADLRLVVVGNDTSPDGRFKKSLEEEVAKLKIQNLVRFLPWQAHMGPIYEASDIVVQPSLDPESFGYVALEGMLAGKPVIASRCGGPIDVVADGETGLLVKPGDIDELSGAILKISENRNLGLKFGEHGKIRAKTLFTMEKNAAHVQELYGQMLASQRILIAESGSGYGGTAKYLSGLLPLLRQKKFTLEAVAYGKGSFIQQIRTKGYMIYHRPFWFFPWGEKRDSRKGVFPYGLSLFFAVIQLFMLVPAITFWIKRRSISLVHLNNDIRTHLPLLIAAHLTGCKILCHLHGWKRLTRSERIAARWVNEFVVLTESGAQYYSSQLKGRILNVIPNGVISEDLRQSDQNGRQLRNRLRLNPNAKLISMVGRLVPLKGHEIFIQALQEVIQTNPETFALILGNDPTAGQTYLKKLEHLAHEFGILSHVFFLPWQEDVWSVYAASDLILHTSQAPEPFSLVVAEAMLAGKAVIATKGGGVEDLISHGQTGWVVEPGNVGVLSSGIRELISNQALSDRLADRAQEQAKQFLTPEQNASKVKDLYDKLLRIASSETNLFIGTKRKLSETFKRAMFYTGGLRLMRRVIYSKVPILMYHRIVTDADPFFPGVSVAAFRKQLEYVKRSYRLVSLDEMVECLRNQKGFTERSLAVTLDDGDAHTWSLAYPILRELQIPVTVFLPTVPIFEEGGFIWTDLLRWYFKLTKLSHYSVQLNGTCSSWYFSDVENRLKVLDEVLMKLKRMENGQRKKAVEQLESELGVKHSELPERWLLTKSQVKSFRRDRIQFGAHTMTHPILSKVPLSEARYEIYGSKKQLEELLSEKIRHFAYPNGELGDFNSEHERLVAGAGFESACSTVLGLNDQTANPYALRRIYAAEEPLAAFASRLVGLGS